MIDRSRCRIPEHSVDSSSCFGDKTAIMVPQGNMNAKGADVVKCFVHVESMNEFYL